LTFLACFLGFAAWSAPTHPAPTPDFFGIAAVRAIFSSGLNDKPAAGAASKPSKPAPPPSGENTVCSLNVVNEDPAKILQVLSAQTQTNLVLLSSTDRKLTLNLKDMKLADMLRHICALSGLRYLKVGKTFALAEPEALRAAYPLEYEAAFPTPPAPAPEPKPLPPAPPGIVTSTVLLQHVSSARIAPVLEKMYGKETLTVVAGPAQDSPSLTSQSTSETVGASSSVLPKEPDAALTAKILVIRGPEPLVREAVELARQLDVVRPQVDIQVTVWDINDSALREVGANWNFGSATITEQPNHDLRFGNFTRSGLNVVATIKALEKKDQAKILASPNLSLLDGERGFILIGDRILFPVLVGYSQGNTPIFTKEEERVGIYLQVAASISSDGEITLSLYPQVSTVTGFLEVNGASYPQISTREAQSTLRVRSGETLIMGGLLKTEEIRQLEKVPLLGDLPFLGELFRRRKVTQSSSQVLISIRPVLLKDGN
jgi:type II secretory pathway component GspD/PulD (secretin)